MARLRRKLGTGDEATAGSCTLSAVGDGLEAVEAAIRDALAVGAAIDLGASDALRKD